MTTGRERTPCSGQVAAHREVDGVNSRLGHCRPVRKGPGASTARCRGPDPVTGHGDVEGKLPAEPGPVLGPADLEDPRGRRWIDACRDLVLGICAVLLDPHPDRAEAVQVSGRVAEPVRWSGPPLSDQFLGGSQYLCGVLGRRLCSCPGLSGTRLLNAPLRAQVSGAVPPLRRGSRNERLRNRPQRCADGVCRGEGILSPRSLPIHREGGCVGQERQCLAMRRFTHLQLHDAPCDVDGGGQSPRTRARRNPCGKGKCGRHRLLERPGRTIDVTLERSEPLLGLLLGKPVDPLQAEASPPRPDQQFFSGHVPDPFQNALRAVRRSAST